MIPKRIYPSKTSFLFISIFFFRFPYVFLLPKTFRFVVSARPQFTLGRSPAVTALSVYNIAIIRFQNDFIKRFRGLTNTLLTVVRKKKLTTLYVGQLTRSTGARLIWRLPIRSVFYYSIKYGLTFGIEKRSKTKKSTGAQRSVRRGRD